jgi:putative CocE/NonD family hydrolase
MIRVLKTLLWIVIVVHAAPVYSQESDPVFDATEAMIPMRDGVRLYTQIYVPRVTREPLPFLLLRTPYGTGGLSSSRMAASVPELTADGYIFVVQDIRGRFKSEGQFVMLRQPRESKDPKAIDESTDAYDTIEWLLKNVPNNNGRVGMWGISYPGFYSTMGILSGHPALKAASPQAPIARSASGAQGRGPTGVACRHVDRRRLPSQRRVSFELRI